MKRRTFLKQTATTAVGALAEVEDLDAILEEIQRRRATASDREVTLE